MCPLLKNNVTNPVLGSSAVRSPTTQEAPPPISEPWQVVRVSDGDTIAVKNSSGVEKKIRFCGIDAPEKSQPLGQDSRRNLQALVDEAKKQVMITSIETDTYGRTVGEVFTAVQGREKFLNEEQLTSGMGYYYAQYASKCPNHSALEKAEAIAKSGRKGVWSGNYQRPWDYRKEQRSGRNRS
ncbi:thermonuclease family protein [Nostoc sp. DedSLP04]|uniref:thermonuclease family protein n=1 Tax=Nostoc sp. DedSLP04 TaxID=3075401 RepID=UPI002AD332E5|nr:thermonuclease family protein [Nostoc sp. DedSLP04]MDZ8032054.1 thermonuclease family protein [Nostoc sp. DedSLP04]